MDNIVQNQLCEERMRVLYNKLEEVSEKLDAVNDILVKDAIPHRVKELEDWRKGILGRSALLAGIISSAIAIVAKLIDWK